MSLSDHMFSDATRQAWRDNYNGGQAAGDFFGVYSSSSSDSGSSSRSSPAGAKPVASAQVAKPAPAGPGSRSVAVVGSAPPSAVQGVGGGGATSDRRRVSALVGKVAIGDAPPLSPVFDDEAGGFFLGPGIDFQPNPWVSNAEAAETRWAEPGEWIGGIYVMAADLIFSTGRLIDHFSGTRIVSPRKPTSVIDDLAAGPGALGGIVDTVVSWDAKISQDLHRYFNTGVAVPQGRF